LPPRQAGLCPHPIILWVLANDSVMANDLDDLDEAESGPPAGAGPRARHRRPQAPNHDAATVAGTSGRRAGRGPPARQLHLSLGHALLVSPARVRWAVAGRRIGRTPHPSTEERHQRGQRYLPSRRTPPAAQGSSRGRSRLRRSGPRVLLAGSAARLVIDQPAGSAAAGSAAAGCRRAEAIGGQGEQQATQLVELPPLLDLGPGGQSLLKRLVDGVQRRVHDLFVEQARYRPAIGSSHRGAPQLVRSGLHCLLSETGRQADVPALPSSVGPGSSVSGHLRRDDRLLRRSQGSAPGMFEAPGSGQANSTRGPPR
jgi:hypothetical protein